MEVEPSVDTVPLLPPEHPVRTRRARTEMRAALVNLFIALYPFPIFDLGLLALRLSGYRREVKLKSGGL